jgi:hypothetical protein
MKPELVESIRKDIAEAAEDQQKTAMFHLRTLQHADEVDKINSKSYCELVGVPVSYFTEVAKMVALSKLMTQEGFYVGHY